MSRIRPQAAALAGASALLIWPAGASETTRVGAVEPARSVYAQVVGVAQDGGLPHVGCSKTCCQAARKDPSRVQRVASLALVAAEAGSADRVFLIDATPDFRSQLDSALGPSGFEARATGLPLDGILLTHAHVGHYAGLIYLGRESAGARGVPVHATARMASFLSGNGPWKRLVEAGNIALKVLEPGRGVNLAPGLTVEPLRVPHREEESDVVGYLVAGPSRRLVYLPDVDDWGRWDRDIAQIVASVDVALLDGTFYSPRDLGTRSIAEIPHPMITATMDRLQEQVRLGRRVVFIHLNHSNPALQTDSAERMEMSRRGFEVAADGLRLSL